MKKSILSLLFSLYFAFAFSQSNTGLKGKIVDSESQIPLQSVIITIQNTNLMQLSDSDGKFSFENVAIGNYVLSIRTNGYKEQLFKVAITEDKIIDIGILALELDITAEQQTVLVAITDNDLSDDNSGSESTASLLQSTKDAFLQAAAYNFGAARFSVRGIDNKYANVMINGISMNRVADGRPQYSNWGGLNDATRNQEYTNGSAPSDYAFGGIAGTQEINTRASIYRPGTRISFLSTNTNYSFRTMATHASGMSRSGWAYVLSAGRRWAQNGYFEGTNYDANSAFVSIEKKIDDKHSMNLTAVYAENNRGKNSPNTAEQTELAGQKYNSYWGYQEGEIRNSRIKKTEEPIFMLTHFWKINPKTNLNTTASYQTGQIGNSRIDYTKVDNPDPTYYRKLPSFWANSFLKTNYVGNTPEYIAKAEDQKAFFLSNKQLNWKDIYRINQENSANGSRMVLYEDRSDETIANLNSLLTSQLSDDIILTAGVNYLDSKTRYFKNMLDLLGGTYFTDISTFGRGVQQQSDLNNIDRTLGVGEHYGYNYTVDVTRLDAFTQFKFVYKKVDFYLAQSFSRSGFQREGLYKNGYYPNNSFGKSEKINFDNFGFKGGMTYKITGRNFIDLNGIYMTKAPNSTTVFPNSRLNNTITPNSDTENIKAVDVSYIVKSPKFKARFTGYFSETSNTTDINYYYADAVGGEGAFVSELVTGINKKNRGLEAGLEYQLTSTFKVTGVAAYGEYTFTNNANVSVTDDASATTTNLGKANFTGVRQAGMPQQAYSFGIEYRDPKFWWIGANANYLADNYIDISAIRRTSNYYDYDATTNYRTINQSLADSYLKQEKFAPFFLFNIVGGKSWRIKGNKSIGLFAILNNVLDITYKTGGFEQSRDSNYTADYEDHQSGSNSKFAPKYFYGYGRTFMANLYFTL
ncbi:carboxypeptidase-like regulatory domain-containing protein [Flavobacterium cellulosilyticum]|uniref:TonB-dependent receptor n=1 Tax=Flavobacterium cellulosilyticum TaxID=2541731 RepID=A0A4R5CHW4_9FLAO|nr:carboxypeptidase-like regulatory domain-containing protein [Flavobacterium cellulosilyticum]TDD99751.1 TonB-dependent receptor [Flavobacterium cellulosilyticum]